ncbi:ABC transporter ATP-binding protein/permease [Mycobacterium sp. KBS0706]|uniref:ABC transporter ATP-binding protein/permease n=1 Tax=Mycobacterium sp. KBS0706 TaxID=2578109 RepID=UPI00110FD7E2|nr:SbmA/BacA-like family transporter [Mycobacterium sp. KBS0706]TSD82767.1 ABC transporter ATP-binding protein/permease [Mycobacterium sp. KBS0706]
MDTDRIQYKTVAARFFRAVRDFMDSEVGWKAKSLCFGLVVLLIGVNSLNVANSYVGRNFMTSIADRERAEFVRQALFYIGVFAASTVVSVIARFAEERLALLWREFVTRRAISFYFAEGAYYRLEASGELANPDQRISEDVRAFTITTISFVLMALNGSFTILAFSGVLWLISPLLFIVAVLYATFGSYMAIVIGRPLVKLNYDQSDKEAGFRSGLIHVRENAEPIMLGHHEGRQSARLLHRLEDLVGNLRRIIAVNRNLGFFTTGYNWLIQIIPALIVAPAFIDGEIDFGAITQSAMAFTALVAAFSLVVTQFQSLSSFAAVVARLSSLMDAIEQSQTSTATAIELVDAGETLAYERLTLESSTNSNPLLKDLSMSIPSGTCVLVTGSDQEAGPALFQATAGSRTAGTGRIIRPGADGLLFLAQRPYLAPGTLRQVLVRPGHEGDVSDDRILTLLSELRLAQGIAQMGGLDTERDWMTLLPLREQQLLAIAHVILAKPRFVFLDRIGTVLNSAQLDKVLRLFSENSITYISYGDAGESRELYHAILECGDDGSWRWMTSRS